MSRNTKDALPNFDPQLERAMAAEAVYAFERYLAFGVSPADYCSPALQDVAKAAQDAWTSDGAVGLETVAKSLQRAGKLDGIGGLAGLTDLLTSSAIADPERFVELRRLRMLRESALRIAVAAEHGDLSSALDALGTAQTDAISSARAGDVLDIFDLGTELFTSLTEERQEIGLVHPGLELMRRGTGDFELPSLTILGGGTNVGKSSVALEMLLLAAEHGVTSGYVSCEDPKLLMSSRVMSAFTGMSSRKLSQGRIDAAQKAQLSAAYGPLSRARGKVKFSFPIGGNEIDVCAAMSRMAMQGAKLVVVDYVQAIECSKKQQDRRNEIRWLCARIKAHGFRLGMAVVLLSQLTRPSKGDECREPTKHDLREAGDLENAADRIILIWRDTDDDFAPINVKIGKSKYGNVGSRWSMRRNEQTARLEEDPDSYESAAQRRKRGHQ